MELGLRARRDLGLLEGVWGCACVEAGQGTRIRVGGVVGIKGVGAVQGLEARELRGTGVRQIWGAAASSTLPGQRVWAEPHVATHPPAGCGCDPRGTLASHCTNGICDCDHGTGACACRPNVVGKSCDRCAPHFWSLGGPRGCEPCGCHPTHALHPACDTVSPLAPCYSSTALLGPNELHSEHGTVTAGDGAVPVPAWLRGSCLFTVPGAPLGRPRAGVPRWEHIPGTGGAKALGMRDVGGLLDEW